MAPSMMMMNRVSVVAIINSSPEGERQHAVSRYGRGFMDRLNSLGFAKGGLVEVPHFALGGPLGPDLGRAPR
jgi:hypothetical protein